MKEHETKEAKPEMLKVKVLKTTFLNGKVYSPGVPDPKTKKVHDMIIHVQKTPRVEAAIAQGLIEIA
jgi:hypothetical protein